MEISTEKRSIFCQGIDRLIAEKELEITNIMQRTEQDYSIQKSLEKFMEKGFSLEVAKERDLQKAKQDINEYRQLQEEIGSRKNHLILVPQFVKLNLNKE